MRILPRGLLVLVGIMNHKLCGGPDDRMKIFQIGADDPGIEMYKDAEGENEIHRMARHTGKIRAAVQDFDNVRLRKIPAH